MTTKPLRYNLRHIQKPESNGRIYASIIIIIQIMVMYMVFILTFNIFLLIQEFRKDE
jgi:hypothetical protein